jgi:hypothetical protein
MGGGRVVLLGTVVICLRTDEPDYRIGVGASIDLQKGVLVE